MANILDFLTGAVLPWRGARGTGHVAASATSSGAVTASDSTVLQFRALYVGGAGNVAIKHEEGGAAVTYASVPAGSILPVSGVRVMATSTTATDMVWLDW